MKVTVLNVYRVIEVYLTVYVMMDIIIVVSMQTVKNVMNNVILAKTIHGIVLIVQMHPIFYHYVHHVLILRN